MIEIEVINDVVAGQVTLRTRKGPLVCKPDSYDVENDILWEEAMQEETRLLGENQRREARRVVYETALSIIQPDNPDWDLARLRGIPPPELGRILRFFVYPAELGAAVARQQPAEMTETAEPEKLKGRRVA